MIEADTNTQGFGVCGSRVNVRQYETEPSKMQSLLLTEKKMVCVKGAKFVAGQQPRKCILQAEKFMPGMEKLVEELFFPKTNCFYFLRLVKQLLVYWKKKFAHQLFHAWHKFFTRQEHSFQTQAVRAKLRYMSIY